MNWTPFTIYKEAKVYALAAIAAGLLTAGIPTLIEAPVSAEKQCEVALQIETRYAGKTNLSLPQKRLYDDAVRELNECMK